MKQSAFAALFLALLPVSTSAGTFRCETTQIDVQTDEPSYVAAICEAAEQAEELFEQCNIPPIPAPLQVRIVNELQEGCVGLYHCGEGLIDVLAPPLMEARRGSQSAFAFLTNADYFQSVVVHELAHAALDDLPCPFDACVVADEYLAYAAQVMSLPPDLRLAFSADVDLEKRISRDELNGAILLLAPQRFAQKAWVHLSQRDDPCAFVAQIVDRTVLLDRERFDF